MIRATTLRAAAIIATLGAFSLAGCGGGGGKSMAPIPAVAQNTSQTSKTVSAYLQVELPIHAGSATTASSARIGVASSTKKPQFIDTTQTNSALVVSVTPQDPAEAAQYGTLTVCYNLYTNGVLAASNPPNFIVTNLPATAPGALPANANVQVGFPAPPETDGFQITQYAGQCGSTPYTLPTPPPTAVGNGILVQTPIQYAYMVPGSTNNINAQIGACPAQTVPCPQVVGVAPGAPIVASVVVASLKFDTLPIPSPVREQGAFLLGNGQIGVPIPLEGLDSAGSIIPGLTTPTNLLGGAGPLPVAVTITSSDTTAHTHLYLVDAVTGAIAQAPTNSAGIVIHELNALSDGTITGVPADNLLGGTGGDPYVIVLTTDGVDASVFPGPVTITATPAAPVAPATIPSTLVAVSTKISPQSAVYTAVGAGTGGYVDAANPTAVTGMLSAGGNVYLTDGQTVKIDGSGLVSPASTVVGPLTGLAAAQWPAPASPVVPTFIYAVDQGSSGSQNLQVESPSGVYAYNPATLAVTPVSAQGGSGNWISFNHPVSVVQAPGPNGRYYLYVVEATGTIYRLDIQNSGAPVGGFQEASNVTPAILTSGMPLAPIGPYLGTLNLTTGTKPFLIADPGNNRIAQIDASVAPAVITPYVTGQPFTGLYQVPTSGDIYATTTTGQIYYIASGTTTAVSLGLALGTAIDGPVGQIPSVKPTPGPVQTFTPSNYPLQFQTGSFFSQTATTSATPPTPPWTTPYTLAPFLNGSTGPVFSAAPAAGVGLKADTSAGATTGAGLLKATGGIYVVPPGTAAGLVTTPNSIEFVDATGKLRTLVQ